MQTINNMNNQSTYHYIFGTVQTKKRTNSKKWETQKELTYRNATTAPLSALVEPINTPKLRNIEHIVIDIPASVSVRDVEYRWSLVDMLFTPLFFTNSLRLCVSWEKLQKETEQKAQNQGEGYASVMLNPIIRCE